MQLIMRLLVSFLSTLLLIDNLYGSGSEYPALLGNGYDGLKLEHKMKPCVQGIPIEKSNTSYVAQFSRVGSWTQLQAQMNFDVPGSIILNSASNLARFALKARDTQNTSTYILETHVNTSQKILTNPQILDHEMDTDQFRQECGSQYISVINTGGELHVGIKFYFSDYQFKQEFDAGGALKSIAELGVHINALSDNMRQHASVEIFFHQVGGDLLDLKSMFKSGDIVSCSLKNFDTCENVLKDVWDYSNDRFIQSISNGKDQTIGFQTNDYPHMPHVYESRQVTRERMKLIDVLDQQQYDRDFLHSIRGERLKDYENCDDRCLTRLITSVTGNIRVLKDAIRMSFEDPYLFEEQATLEKLELNEPAMPKLNPHINIVLQYMHLIVPGGMTAAILPLIKYCMPSRQGKV
jgi:hypothetical protein